MKIVFDARIHLNYYSGISRYIICLLEAYLRLFPEDYLIILINPTIKKDNAIYKSLAPFKNVEIKIINAGHMGPANYIKMGKIIRELAPDVYHYPHLDTPIFTGNIPIVATVHDSNSNNKVKKFNDKLGLKSLYFKTSLGLTLKKAKKIIFVSDSIKREILAQYKLIDDEQKYTTIHNGLAADFNAIDDQEVQTILNELEVSSPYILIVGQIRTHKNIERSIAAFKQFSNQNPEFKLVIVGHNYLNLDLNESNIVHFDKVNNVTLRALYSFCSAFLFPSLFEGFGLPILEAFSFGKPVITSNYGATAEVGGDLANLVDPLSVASIASGIASAVHQPKVSNDMIAYAKTFSWTKNAKAVRQIYLDALVD